LRAPSRRLPLGLGSAELRWWQHVQPRFAALCAGDRRPARCARSPRPAECTPPPAHCTGRSGDALPGGLRPRPSASRPSPLVEVRECAESGAPGRRCGRPYGRRASRLSVRPSVRPSAAVPPCWRARHSAKRVSLLIQVKGGPRGRRIRRDATLSARENHVPEQHVAVVAGSAMP
jgi:hypothetical protein